MRALSKLQARRMGQMPKIIRLHFVRDEVMSL